MLPEIEANIASISANMSREKDPERLRITGEYLGSLEAMRERVQKGIPVGPSLSSLRAKLILRLNPGITKTQFKELMALSPTNRSNEQKVFRDFLRTMRRHFVVDETERFWESGDPRAPTTAGSRYKVGEVVLDGNLKNGHRRAVLMVRDEPGITKEQLCVKMRLSRQRARFNGMFRSLLRYVDEIGGKLFVKGYIPPIQMASAVPAKVVQYRVPEEPLALAVFEAMEPGQRYEWAEILQKYKPSGKTPAEAYGHFLTLIRDGFIFQSLQVYYRF